MNTIDIKECGAITGAAEMIAIRNDLVSIWDAIRAENPVEALDQIADADMVVERIAQALSVVPRIDEKRFIILVGPELVGLEAVASLHLDAEVILAVDQSFGEAALRRIANNIPRGLKTHIIGGLPDVSLGPRDSVLVAIGLRGGYRFALLPAWIASVVRRYVPVFSGERILIDPLGYAVNWRRTGPVSKEAGDGWISEMLDSLFTKVVTPLEPQPIVEGAEGRVMSQFEPVEVNS